MATPEDNKDQGGLQPEDLYGPLLILEGGEEDNTVRPTCLPSIPVPPPPPGGWVLPESEEERNALLYGVHISFEGGEEECLVDLTALPPNGEAQQSEPSPPRSEDQPEQGA